MNHRSMTFDAWVADTIAELSDFEPSIHAGCVDSDHSLTRKVAQLLVKQKSPRVAKRQPALTQPAQLATANLFDFDAELRKRRRYY